MLPDIKYTTPDGRQITPIWARQWVAVLVKLPTQADRKTVIECQVPEHLRDLVRTMGRIVWEHPSRSKQ